MQFLCDPLKDALNDKDPYVRKTGALCVAKIYDINAQLVEEQFGFIEKIVELPVIATEVEYCGGDPNIENTDNWLDIN